MAPQAALDKDRHEDDGVQLERVQDFGDRGRSRGGGGDDWISIRERRQPCPDLGIVVRDVREERGIDRRDARGRSLEARHNGRRVLGRLEHDDALDVKRVAQCRQNLWNDFERQCRGREYLYGIGNRAQHVGAAPSDALALRRVACCDG